MSDRISDLQDRLDRLYKLLKELQLAKNIAAVPAAQVRLQLEIDECLIEIRLVEQKYAFTISQQVNLTRISQSLALGPSISDSQIADVQIAMAQGGGVTQQLTIGNLTQSNGGTRKDNLISSFVYAEMDSHVTINRPTTVDVTLSPDGIAQINKSTTKTGKIEIDPTKALILQILPKVNFEIMGESRIEIDSSTLDTTQTVYFDLKPTHLGDGEVWVVVRQSQLPILTLKLTPKILESRVKAQRLSTQGSVQSLPNFSEPPHVLDIREQKNGDQISYQYELRSKLLDVWHWHRYDSKILNGDRKEYVNALYKEIESRWVSIQGDTEAFTEELRAMGGKLLDELFPDDLKRHLWEHRHEIESIMVTSTEPFIPWELIHLKPAGQKHLPDEICFLGQLGLVRWLYDIGYYPPETLTLRSDRCRYIIPHYPHSRYRLPQAEEEAHFLEQTFKATAIDPQPNPVRSALKIGAFDLLHFAGHGEAESGSANAKLLLEGRIENNHYITESLSETTVEQYCQFQKTKPIVLLNACQIGRTGYALTGISGFAQAFLKGGAGAFIGTLWSVGDRPARIFSETLYTALLQGKSLVVATKEAREKSRELGDATWLAYVVYGHPHLTVTLKDSGNCDEDEFDALVQKSRVGVISP